MYRHQHRIMKKSNFCIFVKIVEKLAGYLLTTWKALHHGAITVFANLFHDWNCLPQNKKNVKKVRKILPPPSPFYFYIVFMEHIVKWLQRMFGVFVCFLRFTHSWESNTLLTMLSWNKTCKDFFDCFLFCQCVQYKVAT